MFGAHPGWWLSALAFPDKICMWVNPSRRCDTHWRHSRLLLLSSSPALTSILCTVIFYALLPGFAFFYMLFFPFSWPSPFTCALASFFTLYPIFFTSSSPLPPSFFHSVSPFLSSPSRRAYVCFATRYMCARTRHRSSHILPRSLTAGNSRPCGMLSWSRSPATLSGTMYLFISFRKSTPHKVVNVKF